MKQRGSIPAPKTTCESNTNNLQKDGLVLPPAERSPRQAAAASGTNSPYLQSRPAAGRARCLHRRPHSRAVEATRAKAQSFGNVCAVSAQSPHVHPEGRAPGLAEACTLRVFKCNNFRQNPDDSRARCDQPRKRSNSQKEGASAEEDI